MEITNAGFKPYESLVASLNKALDQGSISKDKFELALLLTARLVLRGFPSPDAVCYQERGLKALQLFWYGAWTTWDDNPSKIVIYSSRVELYGWYWPKVSWATSSWVFYWGEWEVVDDICEKLLKLKQKLLDKIGADV
jgi:hypothetical protein